MSKRTYNPERARVLLLEILDRLKELSELGYHLQGALDSIKAHAPLIKAQLEREDA